MYCFPIRIVIVIFTVIVFACITPLYSADSMDFNNRGVEAFNRKDYSTAILLLERALSLEPGNEIIRNNLVNAYQALGDNLAKKNEYKESIALLKKAINLSPSNFFAHMQIGAYYLNMGDWVSAIPHLETAIRLKPGHLDAHELLGEAYYRDNDIVSARIQWEYVLQMDPGRKTLKERYDKICREEVVEKTFYRIQSRSRHFSIAFPRDMEFSVREYVVNQLEKAYLDIGRKLGGVFPMNSVHVILYDSRQFNQVMQLGNQVGGVYDGKIRLSVMDERGNVLPNEEITRRIYHEYVHVVIYEMLKDKVPWWVNEGLAEMFSKEFGEREKKMIQMAGETGDVISFKDLEIIDIREISKTENRTSLAYVQSHSAVLMLWNRFGQGRFLSFLRALQNNSATEESLKRVYGIDYTGLLKNVLQFVQN